MTVVIMSKLFQFPLQVAGVPEECMVKAFATSRADQSFDEGMR
jgi:hypothetical protein